MEGKSVKIPSESYKRLKALAEKEGRFITHLLAKAIRNFLIAKKVA